MGNSIKKRLFGQEYGIILMLGLDNAGRTVILYFLKSGKLVTTIPTIGFNAESVRYRKTRLCMWDVSGSTKARPLYHHYYPETKGLIYVIDCSDTHRLEDAMELLEVIVGHQQLEGVPVLVLAHKQDIVGGTCPDVISEHITQKGILRNHTWKIYGTSVMSNEGKEQLYAGLDWLTQTVVSMSKQGKSRKTARIKPYNT